MNADQIISCPVRRPLLFFSAMLAAGIVLGTLFFGCNFFYRKAYILCAPEIAPELQQVIACISSLKGWAIITLGTLLSVAKTLLFILPASLALWAASKLLTRNQLTSENPRDR